MLRAISTLKALKMAFHTLSIAPREEPLLPHNGRQLRRIYLLTPAFETKLKRRRRQKEVQAAKYHFPRLDTFEEISFRRRAFKSAKCIIRGIRGGSARGMAGNE